MKRDEGWALFTPAGFPIAATFSQDLSTTQSLAFDYLQSRSWARKPCWWKNWDGFVKERQKRGWDVCRVGLFFSFDNKKYH